MEWLAAAAVAVAMAARPAHPPARCPPEDAALRALQAALQPTARGRGTAASPGVADAYDRAVLAHVCRHPGEPRDALDTFVRALPGFHDAPVPVAVGPDAPSSEALPSLALQALSPDAVAFLRRGGDPLPPGGALTLLSRATSGWIVAMRLEIPVDRIAEAVVMDPPGTLALVEEPSGGEGPGRLTLLHVGAGGATVLLREETAGGVIFEGLPAASVTRSCRQAPEAPDDAALLFFRESVRRVPDGVERVSRSLNDEFDAWRSFMDGRAQGPAARLRPELPQAGVVLGIDGRGSDRARLRVRPREDDRPACDAERARIADEFRVSLARTADGYRVEAVEAADCTIGAELLSPAWTGPLPDDREAVLAAGQAGPVGIAVDATHVYWLDAVASHRRALRVPLRGGPIEKLGEAGLARAAPVVPGPARVAVAGANVYWTTDAGGAVWAGKASGQAQTLFAAPGRVAGVAADAAGACWAEPDRGAVRCARKDAPAVVAGIPGASAVAMDGPRTFVTARGGRVFRVEGGEVKLLYEPLPDEAASEEPGAVAVDGGRVFWTRPAAGLVLAAPETGGLATVLAADVAHPCAVAADAAHVWVAACGDGSVHRVAKAGGPVHRAWTWPDGVRAMAADATHLYVATAHRIVRVPKDGFRRSAFGFREDSEPAAR